MKKLIIFDWDDVIGLNAKEGYFACYDAALKAVNVSLDEKTKTERIISRWGKPFWLELDALLAEHPEKLAEACKAFDESYWSGLFLDKIRVVDNALVVLKRLSQKYKLGVVTGNIRPMLEKIMKKFNIPEDLFIKIYSSYDIEPSLLKPDPYTIDQIIKIAGVTKDETVYVGDAPSDVQMAKNAGVTCVVVLTGHLDEQRAREMKADYIIDDINSLEKILKG